MPKLRKLAIRCVLAFKGYDTRNISVDLRANLTLKELDRAKEVIADLEADLKSERTRLRVLATEQDRVQREKDNILLQLQRTESVGVL